MRRDSAARLAPEWVTLGQGLGAGHIECRAAQVPFCQYARERVAVHEVASSHVDKQATGLYGAQTPLTSLELGILRLLAAHPGEVIGRERFLNELWGVSYYGTTRTLDSRMATLRRKLGPDGAYIETQRGLGYRFNPPPENKK